MVVEHLIKRTNKGAAEASSPAVESYRRITLEVIVSVELFRIIEAKEKLGPGATI